jgi:ParB/RepB/Spo0J family partition protein
MKTPESYQVVKLADIVESASNPRKYFNDDQLKELAASITEKGVQTPIRLRPIEGGKKYELVYGARRFRASKLAERINIPAIVVSMTDDEALDAQITENLQRVDVHPMEEAESYEVVRDTQKLNAEGIAKKYGKHIRYVGERLQLLNLCEKVRKAFYDGKLLLAQAILIAKIADESKQLIILDQIEKGYCRTAADVKKKIEEQIFVKLSTAPFKVSDPDLLPLMGACTSCQYNTATRSELFDNEKGQGKCTKPKCFTQKIDAWWKQLAATETAKGNIVLTRTESRPLFDQWSSRELKRDSEYVMCSDPCDEHPKKHTFKQLCKGQVKEYIALNRKNQIRRLYKKVEVVACLKDQAWAKKATTEDGSLKKPQSDTWARDRRREEITRDMYSEKLQAGISKVLTGDTVLEIIAGSISMHGSELKKLGFKVSGGYFPDAGTKYILPKFKKLKGKERYQFLIKVLLANNEDDVTDGLARFLRIDEKKIKLEARKIESAEFRASLKKKDDKKEKERQRLAKGSKLAEHPAELATAAAAEEDEE